VGGLRHRHLKQTRSSANSTEKQLSTVLWQWNNVFLNFSPTTNVIAGFKIFVQNKDSASNNDGHTVTEMDHKRRHNICALHHRPDEGTWESKTQPEPYY